MSIASPPFPTALRAEMCCCCVLLSGSGTNTPVCYGTIHVKHDFKPFLFKDVHLYTAFIDLMLQVQKELVL